MTSPVVALSAKTVYNLSKASIRAPSLDALFQRWKRKWLVATIWLVGVVVFSSSPLKAAIFTWNAAATGPAWNVASNWANLSVPGSGDVAQFAANLYSTSASAPTLAGTANLGGIWDTGAGTITIGGTNALTLFGTTINSNTGTGIELDAGAGPLNINAPLVLQNNQNWYNNSSSTLTINGNISGGGNLTMLGSGFLSLTGLNTYTGNTTVVGGTLAMPSGSLASPNQYIGNPGTGSFEQLGGTNSAAGEFDLGDAPGAIGSYTLSGGSFTCGGIAERIGYSGSGSFTQTGGTNSMSRANGQVILGDGIGGSGSYYLSGNGLLLAAYETIGGFGNGNFTQMGGTNYEGGVLTLGDTGTGNYNLSGGSLFAGISEEVGASGSGNVTQTGGTNSTGALVVGINFGSATYNLSGSGLISTPSEAVGEVFGSGTMSQSGGTNAVAGGTLWLGYSTTSSGMCTLSNTGVLTTQTLIVGNSGSGTFIQSGGVATIAGTGALYVGYAVGASGSYSLSTGTAAAPYLSATNEYIGYSGTGSFTQSSGTNVVSGFDGGVLVLGDRAGSTGDYNLSGGSLFAGAFEEIGASGVGNMMQTGGTNSTGALYVGLYGGSGTYNLSGSGLISTPSEYIGAFQGTGIMSQSGGTNSLASGGTLSLGYSTTSSGMYTLSNTGLLTTPTLIVGNSGSGTFIQSGGVATITGTGGTLYVGYAVGSSGSYSLTAGTAAAPYLSAATEYIGYSGTGSFTQTAGTNSVGNLHVAYASHGGTYSLGGSGVILAQTEFLADMGIGVFTQTGGTNTVSNGIIFTLEGEVVLATYNLNGGLLAVSGSGMVHGSGSSYAFNFGGGTLGAIAPWSSSLAMTLTGSGGNATIDTTGGSITLSGVLSGTGALNKVGANILTLSGSNTYSGGTTIAGGVLQAGNNLALGSGTAALSVNSPGTLDVHGYSLNAGALSGGGAIDNLSGTGSLTVGNDNSSSTFSGTIQNTAGQLSLNKAGYGQLTLNGSSTYTGGTTISNGTLQLGDGATTNGYIASNIAITGGILAFAPVAPQTYAGQIASNFGSIAMLGPSPLALSGANSGSDSSFFVNGGTLAFTGANSGNNTFSVNGGMLALTGSGTFTSSTNYVGYSGNGALLVTDSAAMGFVTLYIGDSGAGVIALAGNAMLGGGTEFVGDNGVGIFNQSGGTSYVNTLYLSHLTGSSGTYNLSGGSLSADTEYVGYGAGGTFNQTGGSNNAGSGLSIGSASGSGAYYFGPNGVLTAANLNVGSTSGNQGTFVQSGGSCAVQNNVYVASGSVTLSGGTFAIFNAVFPYAGGNLFVGNGGGTCSVTQTGGVIVQNYGSTYVGVESSGVFIQSGGTNSTGTLYLGGTGSFASNVTGSYTLSGSGVLQTYGEQIGNGCAATFTQSGGTNNCNGGLALSPTNRGVTPVNATYNLSGSSSLLISSGLNLGNYLSNTSGSAAFNQSGGTNSIIQGGELYTDDYGVCIYSLSGGVLCSPGGEFASFPNDYFNQSGGVNSAGTLNWYSYKQTGGSITAPVQQSRSFSQSGGTNNASSVLQGVNYSLNGGLLLLAGSGVADPIAGGTFNFGGGTLGATASWSSSLAMNLNGNGGNATIDTTGGNITLSGALSGSGGLTKVGPGTLALTGVNTYGGPFLSGSTAVDGGTLALGGGQLQSYNQFVGYNATGAFVQSGGTNAVGNGYGNLFLGENAGSNGTYSLNSGSLAAYSEWICGSGTGSFVQSGGTNTAVFIYVTGDPGARGSYMLAGGVMQGAPIYIGGLGSDSFNQTGGFNADGLYIGNTGTGTVTQSGGTNSSGVIFASTAPNAGSYTLSGSGLFSGALLWDGSSNSSSFIQSGGTANMSSLDMTAGSYALSGTGLLYAPTQTIGDEGPAFFSQAGGTNSVAAALYVGRYVRGQGTYSLSGSGYLSAASEYVGSGGLGPSTIGTFNQSGGTNSVGSILQLAVGSDPTGTYNLDGGLLVLAGSGLMSGAGSATFNFGGGTLGAASAWSSTVAMTLTGSGGNATIDTTGGNISLAGSLTGPGGLIKAGPNILTLSASNNFTGTTLVSAGTLLLANTTALAGSTLDTSGSGSLSFGTLTAAAFGGLQGSGSLTLNNASPAAVALSVGGNNASTTFSGGLSGSGSLAKVGSGTLTLSGSNTYSGGTTLAAGELSISASSNLGAPAAPVVFNGGTLQITGTDVTSLGSHAVNWSTFNGGFDVASAANVLNVGNAIGGTGSLSKLGAGTLLLTASNTYSGGTQVNGGTLRIGPAGSIVAGSEITVSNGAALAVAASTNLPGNTINVNPGGLFDTSGASGFSLTPGNLLTIGRPGGGGTDLNGNFTLGGGTIDIGGTGTAATLTEAGNLTLAGGALKFDLSSTGAGDLASVAGLNLTSTTTFAFNFTSSSLADGSYPLIDYAGSLTGSATTLKTAVGHVVRQSFTLVASGTSDGVLSLVVAGAPANIIWTGSQSNAWDTATLNWNNGGTADKFYNNDAVTFDDTAAASTSGAVTINAEVFPGSVHFNNNTLNYTLSGSGSIGGAAGLTKSGSGTITLAGSNSFSGDTAINQGAVQLANANALPNSTVSVNVNGGLTFSPAVGTFNLGGLAGDGSFALSDTAGAAVTLNVGGNNASSTFYGGMSGSGSLAKVGSGTLTLSGSNTYSGGTTVAGGILQIGSGTSGSISGNITNNAALVFARADNSAFSGAVSGSGSLTQAGTGTLTLSGSSSYSGGTTIAVGTLKLDFSQPGAPAANIINNLGNVSTLTLAGGTLAIQGNLGAANSQSFNGLVVNPGSSAIVLTAAGTNSLLLSLGGITSAGGQVDFTLPSGTQSATNGITTTTPNDAGGILGSFATVGGGTDWACVTGTADNITAYNGYTGGDLGQIPSNGALNVSPSGPQTAVVIAKQFNSLKLSGTVGVTMAGSGSLTLLDGGLICDTSGTMGGGTLAGSPGGELTVVTPANITISSVIADDGGPTALVKAGTGVLTLTGSNTYSGGTTISAGTLAVTGAASLGVAGGGLSIGPTTLEVAGNFSDARNINLTAPASTIQVDPAFTYSNSGTLSGPGGLTLSGSGTLVLSGSSDYTGGTFVDDGTLIVTNNEAIADGSSFYVGDPTDLGLFFGQVTPASAGPASASSPTTAVPEPGTLALFVAGALAAFAAWRTRD